MAPRHPRRLPVKADDTRPRCEAVMGRCSRAAVFRDQRGHLWCRQHAKDYPTIYAKSTGQIRPGMTLIEEDKQ